MLLSSKLLLTPTHPTFLEAWSEGPSNVLGTYSPQQFSLKLSPDIHRAISLISPGIVDIKNCNWDGVQAFSTGLHETVHWWQHIGSTSGFMFSLASPVQFHSNYGHLKKFLQVIGHKMPIINITSSKDRLNELTDEAANLCNTIINNYKDIDYFYFYQFSPEKMRRLSESFYFESLGHSFTITYGSTISTLDAIFYKTNTLLPRPDNMMEIYHKRKSDKIPGYYHGSPIVMPPFGIEHIFEGQARFIQMQYLFFASKGKFGFSEAKSIGMMSELYTDAFDLYLNITGQPYPPALDDNIVNLFLLICDISINPTAGFPIAYNPTNDIIRDNSPGIRFFRICNFVKSNVSKILSMVAACDKEAYIKTSDFICEGIGIDGPMKGMSAVKQWCEDDSIKDLMVEHKKFKYRNENTAIRLLFAHFIEFSNKKLSRPEFFCWPAHWMAGARVDHEYFPLFSNHQAPFVNNENDDGVYPRLRLGISEQILTETLSKFYSNILIYDLARQWMVGPKCFQYDHEWLSKKNDYAEMKNWLDGNFQNAFGVSTNSFEFIRAP